MKMRLPLVALMAVLAGFMVVRVAVVGAFSASAPDRAAAIWPDHPAVILESGLAEIGRATAGGGDPNPALVNRLLDSYRKTPLAPEPLLVRGVQAQSAGDDALAGRAFVAARNRAPRSVAARYFLAEHFQRTGQIEASLEEISALARLVPQSLPDVAPFLATLARTPGAAPRVKAVIQHQPQLEIALLNALAADATNLDLVLELWSGRGGETARFWQARLLNAVVAAGQYDTARAAWLRFTGADVAKDELPVHGFGSRSLPPFGWSLASGPSGVAEPDAGGGLHILYYGRDRLLLASQLMTLSPGRYRLALKVGSAQGADTLSWSVRCLPASNQLTTLDLGNAGKDGTISAFFAVPSGCPAQMLELVGVPSEISHQVDLTIGELRLQREDGR